MSVLLAVVPAVTASPSPSPEVLIKTVEVIPQWVTQLGTVLQQLSVLGLLVIPGYLASKFHNFVNPKLGRWGNTMLLYGYSVVLGVLGLLAANTLDLAHIDFHNPEVIGSGIAAVLAAATVQYNSWKAKHPGFVNTDTQTTNF